MPILSIIIPTLNEGERIRRALEAIEPSSRLEVIVVDGGSTDDTLTKARSWGAWVMESPPGRALQMNAGAAAACGEILLFLHADTQLPRGFAGEIVRVMGRGGVSGGAFRLRFDQQDSVLLRLVERTANWRAHYLQLPFGDQGIFVRRAVFLELGGFPTVPIMEDVELLRRLRRKGRIVILPSSVVSSARRYERDGILRRTLLNKAVSFGHLVGVSPLRLQRWYERGGTRRRP